MCLTAKSKLRKSRKDRVVYKVFKYNPNDKKNLFTYYQNTLMEMGKTYTEDCEFADNQKKIDKGMFHSFTNLEDAVQLINLFRSCLESKYKGVVIVKCIIPKDTKYFLGSEGDIASSSIVLKEFASFSEIKKVKLYSIKEKSGWIWRYSLKENEIEKNIKVLTNMIFPTIRREDLEIIEQTPIE